MPASTAQPSGNGRVSADELAALHAQVRAAADQMHTVVHGTPDDAPTTLDTNVERFLHVADIALANARYYTRNRRDDTTRSEYALLGAFLNIFQHVGEPEQAADHYLFIPAFEEQDAYDAIRLIVATAEHIDLD